MGIEMETLSLKASAEEKRKADEIVQILSPFVTNRSQVLRLGLNVLYGIVSIKDTVSAAIEVLQGILRNTAYTQSEFHFPPRRTDFSVAGTEEGAGSPLTTDRKRPRVVAFSVINHRVRPVGVERAWRSSFLSHSSTGRVA